MSPLTAVRVVDVLDDQAVLDSLLADSVGRAAPVAARDLTEKPVVRSCRAESPPDALAGRDGAVVVAYIVDTLGRVEPASVRIVQASHAGLIPAAIASVQNPAARSSGSIGGDGGRS